MRHRQHNASRKGGIYIAVLGTSMLVAMLGLAALMAQRIQGRLISQAADIRQAQLNANSAVELALLTMKQNPNWRTAQSNGDWFTFNGPTLGTATANVTDPRDGDLANGDAEPVVVRGVGNSGQAQQRVEVTLDPRREPLSCLRSAVAVGGSITLSNDTLRTGGVISATDVSASSSQVHGTVQATSISGSMYNGATTQIGASDLPAMPDWSTVFEYYKTNGTQLPISNLPTTAPNLGRNIGIESGTTNWTGAIPWSLLGTVDVSQNNNFKRSGSNSLLITNRSGWYSGPVQRIDEFVKPGAQYYVEMWVYVNGGIARNFAVSLVTKGTASVPQVDSGPVTTALIGALNIGWTRISATLTAPAWIGDLEYAFVMVGGGDTSYNGSFYVDDLEIREQIGGRLIYRQVLSPSVNTLYAGAPTNSQGIYWIDCNNERLVIERSRILGTLLVINPGANSCVNNGPINWAPAVPGYPALLVDAQTATNANFSLRSTNRVLSEAENGVNFNPAGAPYQFNNAAISATDSAANDLYPSEIRGMVVVRNDVNFQNRPLIRGQLVVGGSISSSSGELEVDYQPGALLNPPPGFFAPHTYVRRPGSVRKVVVP